MRCFRTPEFAYTTTTHTMSTTTTFVTQAPLILRPTHHSHHTSPLRRPPRMVTKTLSPQDKEYLHKVRERLLKTSQIDEPARHDLSRMYERPDAERCAEFVDAMRAFNVGQYGAAADLFSDAVDKVGGIRSTRGGRIGLWLAQAHDAAGSRCRAVSILETLTTHKDSNISNTANELLFIVTAPKLEVPRDSFVEIPHLDTRSDDYHPYHLATRRLGRKKNHVEKYSLEWYAKLPRPSKHEQGQVDHNPAALLLVAGSAAALVALAMNAL